MRIIGKMLGCWVLVPNRFGRRAMSTLGSLRLRSLTRVYQILICCLPALSPVSAQDSQDKGEFNLFNRTPERFLRSMEADRPDITESPRTVDAGWSQIEMSFFEWGKDGGSDELLRIPSTNFKLGINSKSDLQIIVNGWDRRRSMQNDAIREVGSADHGSHATSQRSLGTNQLNKPRENLASTYIQETRLRWKRNLIGNDHEVDSVETPSDQQDSFSQRFALGIISTVIIPSGPGNSASNQPEFGISFPWSYELSAAYELMGQTEFQLPNRYRGAGDSETGFGCDYLQTLGLGYPVYGPISGYYEQVFISSLDKASQDGRAPQLIGSFGFVYELSPNFTLDLGVQLGLNHAATDHLLFSGMTTRF